MSDMRLTKKTLRASTTRMKNPPRIVSSAMTRTFISSVADEDEDRYEGGGGGGVHVVIAVGADVHVDIAEKQKELDEEAITAQREMTGGRTGDWITQHCTCFTSN
jgi:hypothetical protein